MQQRVSPHVVHMYNGARHGMKHGVYAETPMDKVQNKLRGVGSLMLRERLPLDTRLVLARAIYKALGDSKFAEIQRNRVFSAFFARDEINGDDGIVTRIVAIMKEEL